jgi:hypothetical protein
MKTRKLLVSQATYHLNFIVLLLSVLFLCPERLHAKPVTAQQARKVVKGFLTRCPNPLQTPLGLQLDKVDTFTNDDGQILYYVVYLKPSGFVIVPADDFIEPVIAFVSRGTYDPSPANPLGTLVTNDLSNRIAAAQNIRQTIEGPAKKAKNKWDGLIQYADDERTIQPLGTSSVSDVRVAPLVQSTWGQTTVGSYINGITCYNYYTPGDDPYSTGGYPCGCVATAMAQLMRYHEYPTGYVGTGSFLIEVDYVSQWVSLFGGPYVWSDMPLVPNNFITLAQRQAIGEICYDAGVSVNMSYRAGGSSASLYDADGSLVSTFDYTNCVHGYNYNSNIGAGLDGMMNPNLDAQLPVILGIHDTGGHAVICDGYGYSLSTLYHHLNMGWSGNDDAWYDLPEVDAYYYFDVVDTCLYNIFTSGSGEIISGRITDPNEQPLSGVTVSANGGAYSATTNANGIYALVNVPSNTSFTVNAAGTGWSFGTKYVTTGESTDNYKTSGNRWAVNFQGYISGTMIQFEKDVYIVPENLTVKLINSSIKGAGSDDVLLKICEGDCETVTVTESPANSGIFLGGVPTAEGTPASQDGIMQITENRLVIAEYEDSNDITGYSTMLRDTAALTMSTVLLQADFSSGIPATWSVVDGLSDGRTWTTYNPAGRTSPYWNGLFVLVDSDYAGSVDMDEQLITPPLDLSGYNSVNLSFGHAFVYFESEIGDVDVQVGTGSWQNVARYQGLNTSGNISLDISDIAAGKSDVRIRWHYYNANWEYYWGIDNVSVTVVTEPPAMTKGDFEPDCDVDLEDFSTLASAWLSETKDSNWDGRCDISDPNDSIIDSLDLEVFSQNWLWQ